MSDGPSEAWKALKRAILKNDPEMARFVEHYHWPTYQARQLNELGNAFARLDAATHNILNFELNEIRLAPNTKILQKRYDFFDSWKGQLTRLCGEFPLWEARFFLINHLLLQFPQENNTIIAKKALNILKEFCEIPLKVLPTFNTIRQVVAKQRKSLDKAKKE